MIDSPDFPHGTPAGFDLGCHGTVSCTNHGTGLMTCMEAHIRFQGDYAYRLAVKAGTANAEKEMFRQPKPPRMVLETVEQAEKRPKKKQKPKAQRVKLPGVLGRPVVMIMYGKEGVKHGTPAGARTCNTNCPSEADGGISCNEARRKYQRDYRAKRLAGAGPALVHGTTNAYQMGCNTIAKCPLPTGETCTDLKRAASKASDVLRKGKTA
jgi:hypothetical protein